MASNQQNKKTISPNDIALYIGVILLAVLVLGMATGRCTGSVGPPGEAGPVGPAGPKGDVGDVTTSRGPQGDKGDSGNAGSRGEVGPAGESTPGEPGPAGDTGALGPVGPQGEIGETGATGLAGPVGPEGLIGPQGQLTYIHPPHAADTNPRASFDLMFSPAGTEIINPIAEGTPLEFTRKRLDLSSQQAARLQFSHQTNAAAAKISIQYFAADAIPPAWIDWIPATGAPGRAHLNQVSEWYATPRHFADLTEVLVRAVLHGDGEVDPLITYIRLDVR